MTIDGINFNKLPKKNDVNKTQKEAPKGPSVEPEMSEQEKTALEKIRSKALSSYVAALIALGGAPALQSCGDVEQNQVVDIDQAAILDKLDQILKLNQQMLAQMQSQYDILVEMNSDNKELKQLVKDIIAQNKSITTLIQGIGTDVDAINTATLRIVALLENSNANDAEFLAKLDKIINGQATETEKLNQILQANQEQNQTLINIEKLLEAANDSDKNLGDILNQFINDYKQGEATKSEMIQNIIDGIIKNGNVSTDILNALNDLSKKYEAGQITESEMLAKITELLQSIDSKLGDLQNAVNNIKAEFPDLGAKLDQLIQQHQEGKLTDHALMSAILNEIKAANTGDADFKAQLDAILNAINNNQLTTNEAMDKIIDLLGKIESNTAGILEAVNKISGQIAQLDAKWEANQSVVLDGIKDAIGGIGGKLDQVIANQEKGNETLVEISDKIDKVNANLNQIGDKILTKQDLQEILGDLYDKLADKITGSQITVGDLEALLQAYKTDLTRTNALIETLVNLVASLDIDGGNSEALTAIKDAINAFQNQSAGNAADVQDKLQAVLDTLAGMQGSLDALVKIGNDVKANQDKFMASATTYGTKLMDEISKIGSNMLNQDALNVYLDSYTEYLQKAEQQRQEQLAVLKAILENMGQGNAVDIDDLIAKLPNYTDILNEIRDAIGNLVTADDLERIFVNTKPDLTRTNALIETLVNLVASMDFTGGGNSSVDLTEVKSLIAEVRDLIKNQQTPSAAQINQIISLLQGGTSANTRAAGGTYYHQGWNYN